MKKPAVTAPASGPTIALEAHVAELRATIDTRIAETAPPIRPLRRYDEATVDKIVERYLAGASTVRISADLGIPIRTVGYQLARRGIERRPSSVPHKHPAPGERVCAREGCGERFTPTGHQAAQPGGGRFCSRACARAAQRVADPEPRACRYKHCGKIFTPWPSEAVRPGRGQFCSHRCRQLHFWRDEREKVEAFLHSVDERYTTPAGRAHLIKASARGLYVRHGSTHAFGRHAALFAAEKGKKVGRRSEAEPWADRIDELLEHGLSERAIGRIIGISDSSVHRYRVAKQQTASKPPSTPI
jgi:hypothetical protein